MGFDCCYLIDEDLDLFLNREARNPSRTWSWEWLLLPWIACWAMIVMTLAGQWEILRMLYCAGIIGDTLRHLIHWREWIEKPIWEACRPWIWPLELFRFCALEMFGIKLEDGCGWIGRRVLERSWYLLFPEGMNLIDME